MNDQDDEALLNSYIDEMLELQLKIRNAKDELKALKKNCVQTLGITPKELNAEIKKYE